MDTNQLHKPGVNETYLRHRHLQLEGLSEGNGANIIEEVSQLMGVDSVEIDLAKRMLHVSYDASKRDIDEVEEIVKQQGCDISGDWWTHVKEGWYRYTDQNIKDNAQHEPWSCHQRPPGK